MLREICIENLAVIQRAVIPVDDRLNIFTGETGAGKSILINGINAILGYRITKDIVRSGCKKAVITALFTDISETVTQKLSELGFDCEDEQLIISREILANGGSVARINSRTASVSALKAIGELLINIHGQHDNQILFSPDNHLEIIDSFNEDKLILSDYMNSFKELQDCARKLGKLKALEQDKEYRTELLNTRISEIGELELDDEEEDIRLEEEYELAKNSEAISVALRNVVAILDNDESSVSESLGVVNSAIEDFSDLSEELKTLYDRVETTKIEVEDITSEFKSLLSSLDFDENRFRYVQKRREKLRVIKKKYGADLSAVIKTYNESINELELIEESSNEIENIIAERDRLLSIVTEKAKKLTESRLHTAEIFVERVTHELEFLNMPNVRFEVSHQKGKLTKNGMDIMEFMLSANAGEPAKPIAKFASGGELSRIMLALKIVSADKEQIPTMIFDEIDTGVSGRAAQKIGIKLREISRIRQVLCVTHLAQIAVMADNHLLIEKNIVDEHTATLVNQLDSEKRKYEIARIMGGDNLSELMLQNAQELLDSIDS